MEDEDVSSKAQTRSWQQQPNFVWDIILDYLIPGSDQRGSFEEFYRVVVDGMACNRMKIDKRLTAFIRIPFLLNSLRGAQVLGIPNLSEGFAATCTNQYTYAFYQKLYAFMDKPSLASRSVSAQNSGANG